MATWPQAIRNRLYELSDCFIAFWKSDRDGKPSNGGSSDEPACPGLVQKVQGPLELCTNRALHATLKHDKWNGERLWVVALKGDVQISEDKCGALEREILGEVILSKECGELPEIGRAHV